MWRNTIGAPKKGQQTQLAGTVAVPPGGGEVAEQAPAAASSPAPGQALPIPNIVQDPNLVLNTAPAAPPATSPAMVSSQPPPAAPATPPTAKTWGSPAAGPARTLVLYDTAATWIGSASCTPSLRTLTTRFGPATAEPVASYQAGQAALFTAVIYIGSTYNEPLPPAFLSDVPAYNHSARQVQTLLDISKANLVNRDGYASFFFHAIYPPAVLDQILTGMQAQGYTFVSPEAALGH